jgi:hypothetical protein
MLVILSPPLADEGYSSSYNEKAFSYKYNLRVLEGLDPSRDAQDDKHDSRHKKTS